MTEWVDEDELTITYGTLRKAMAESAEAERERIIALIKSTYPHWEEWDWNKADPGILADVIALIKGDEK